MHTIAQDNQAHRWLSALWPSLLLLLLLLAGQFFINGNSFAYDLTLAWNQNPEPECPQAEQPCLAGYKLCWGNQSSIYDWCADLPLSLILDHENPQATIGDLLENTQYYFAVKAYNDFDPIAESGYSNEIYYAQYTGPASPTGGQITYELLDEEPITSNGFMASSPSVRHGDSVYQGVNQYCIVQKFVCPGSGTIEISEIGFWGNKSGSTAYVIMGIFTHDAVNDCPESIIVNSETPLINISSAALQKYFHTYSIKPQLIGGITYWLAWRPLDGPEIDYFVTGGNSLDSNSGHPIQWPDATEWHTHTDRIWDLGIYVVYVTGR